MKLFAAVLLLMLPGLVTPQVVNVSGKPLDGPRRESLRIPLNGVIVVSLPSGQRALIQFTSIGGDRAEYRWKYRRSPQSALEVGVGTVVEKYERMPAREGRGSEVLPLPGHDIIVRAGEIRGEWSVGGDKHCHFYFNPKLAVATLAAAARFEGDP